jgi:GTPase SAR1 family protein
MPQQPINRQNLIGLVCGTRGTGKTTFLKKLIDGHTTKKTLVVDANDNILFKDIPVIKPELLKRWKAGTVRIVSEDTDLVFDLIYEHLWNALVVFEDATGYMQYNMPEVIKKIMLVSKQRNLDLIFTFHSFRNIRPDFFAYSNYLELFKTGEDIMQFRSKIPQFDAVLKVKNKVESNADKHYHESVRLL